MSYKEKDEKCQENLTENCYLQIGGKFLKEKHEEEAKKALIKRDHAGFLHHEDRVKFFWRGRKVKSLKIIFPENFEQDAENKVREIVEKYDLSYLYAYVNSGEILPGNIFFGIIVGGRERGIYKASREWHEFLDEKVKRINIYE